MWGAPASKGKGWWDKDIDYTGPSMMRYDKGIKIRDEIREKDENKNRRWIKLKWSGSESWGAVASVGKGQLGQYCNFPTHKIRCHKS